VAGDEWLVVSCTAGGASILYAVVNSVVDAELATCYDQNDNQTVKRALMTHQTTVALAPAEILQRAKAYFAERLPNNAAFLEKEGPQFVVLRGQGGEEVVLNATPAEGGSHVRASTLFFDQAIDRFLSTLPLASAVEVA
jgi:hypothetical protein